jgi:hypothetical protein
MVCSRRRDFHLGKLVGASSIRSTRLQCPFLVGLVVAVFLGAGPACSKPCTLPTESELGSLDPPAPAGPGTWTLQEKWIWRQTLAGEVADFNDLYCEGEPLDPSVGDEVWQSSVKPRQVSERFLVDVLATKRFTEAMHFRGLRIVGALFSVPIDLSGIQVDHALWLDRSRFIGPFVLTYAQLGSILSIDGSTFLDTVDLRGATVGGQLNAAATTFAADLKMNNIMVEQSLFLSDGATFHGEVRLTDATVGGHLDASNSTFRSALKMESLKVAQNLILRGGTFEDEVRLTGAEIGGDLDLSGARFHGNVDASSTVIDRELRLGNSWSAPPRWEPTAWLILRNTSVAALQDRLDRVPAGAPHDAWPGDQRLQLDGFSYVRLGGLGGEDTSEMMGRPTSWYTDWLRRDPTFTPQPYRQLASVFREAGADGKANEILCELREREREEAWRQQNYVQWFKLSALKWVIGYGIGGGSFRALFWAGLFTLFGAWVLWSGSGMIRATKSRTWCVWASLDEILPIVQLDQEHEALINEGLEGWRLYYFYVHRVVAFILGSFVIAGLAGLTQGV